MTLHLEMLRHGAGCSQRAGRKAKQIVLGIRKKEQGAKFSLENQVELSVPFPKSVTVY